MAHTHSHTEGSSTKNLFITMVLNFFITIAEIIGGFYSGSLALISDAMHNLSDGIAIIITYAAIRLSNKPRSFKYTFGLKRAEIVAAIINASTLIIISFFLVEEAIHRLFHPSPIAGGAMLVVASLGLAANTIGTVLLKKGSENNLNLRAAYFHLLSDAISSLAVIIGAVCIISFQIYWIDPLLTVLIALFILKETFAIVKESVDVVMMSAPPAIDITDVQSALEAIPGVKNIHHVHLWKMNDADIHFEAHIDVDDVPVSCTTAMRSEIDRCLHDTFEITHTTLQFECDTCRTKALV